MVLLYRIILILRAINTDNDYKVYIYEMNDNNDLLHVSES